MCLFKDEWPATLIRSYTMFMHLSLLCHLSMMVYGVPHCTRTFLESNDEGNAMEEVFTDGEEANMFLGRSLLYNRFDFEIFVPGNAERECYEEVCNYEEAREIFKDNDKTMIFWKEYSTKGPYAKPETFQKIDVTGLLTGLVACGTILIIFWFLGYYIYKYKCKSRILRSDSSVHHERHSLRSSISRRLEHIFIPEPPPPPSAPAAVDLGLPSYEQAVALNDPHDAPPPYPETVEELRLLRKAISLPDPQSP